jgi:4-amino-4-deoxy-L-arabinose transferase-like glycosyltransferase
MTFSALLIGAILILFRIFEDARPKLQSALLAGVLMGAACLAKGPAGIAIPIAIAGLYSVMSLARLKRNILPLALSMIIAGAISGVWYFLAYQVGGERFLEIQLFKENLARLAGDEDYDLGHNSGPLSIGGLLLVGTLPFSFLLIPIALGCWRWRRQIFPKQNPLFVYSLIWIAVFMFIFGIASSKRSVYLMGCFPACAFIINQLILKLSELEVAGTSKIRRLIIWMFALAAIICSKALLALFFAKGLVLSQIKSERLLNSITDILSHSGLLPGLGLIILVLWYLTFDQSRRTAVYGVWAIAVVSTLISAFTAIHVLPRISGQQSPKPFLAEASKQFGTARLVFMDDAYFSANYYSPRQLLPLSDLNKLNPGEAGYLLSRVKSENELPTGFEIFEIVAVSPTLNVQGKDRLTLNRIRKSE